MVALLVAITVLVVVSGAETIHIFRIRRLAALIFGPGRRPGVLAVVAPALRIMAVTALAWGLVTLYQERPRTLETEVVNESQRKHVVLLLDVSPSMRLIDAGPDNVQSRAARARDLLASFFDRVPIQQYRVSLIAFYDKAIPVVIDTSDMEVIMNALSDLPMHFAFKGPKTNLFAGLKTAAEICHPWNPNSTTLIVVSDGDTVPASSGMQRMPASVSGVLVIGVGDPVAGKFIDGRHSRQDVSTLRQVAARTGGEFFNGNASQISSTLIRQLTSEAPKRRWQDLTSRDYALAAILVGSTILALLPILLHQFGSAWNPGTQGIRKSTSQSLPVATRVTV